MDSKHVTNPSCIHPPADGECVPCPPLRCTSLQELDVEWTFKESDELPAHIRLQFVGAGSTALERRASMQRQLAALSSSRRHGGFMAPASWPTHSCLTSFTLGGCSYRQDHTEYMRAAARTSSLVVLEADKSSGSFDSWLRGISCLQRLTSLTFSNSIGDPVGACDEDGIEQLGHLSSLQRMRIALDVLDDEYSNQDAGFAIPASWSALSALTHVDLGCARESSLAVAQLSRLVAVEDLRLCRNLIIDGATAVGGVSSLFALTRLTSLVGPFKFTAPDGDGAGGEAGGSGGLQAPQQWRDGLRRLTWKEYSAGSLSMTTQLTSLTFLEFDGVCFNKQLCISRKLCR
jgi:hypothetical protein